MSLSDLTNKHWLPIDFVKETIAAGKEAGQLKGCQLQGNFVVTEGFSRREVARIRGLLRGITRPAALTQLAHRVKTDETKLKNTIEELVKQEKISGKISKGLFIPTSFINLQRQTVLSQLSQNSYVEDTLIEQLHINQETPLYLKSVLPEGVKTPIKFTGFVLSDTAYTTIEDTISQMCQDGTYMNLNETLPDCFKRMENTHELLAMVDQECRLMADDSHVCSVTFINKCLGLFAKRLEQEAV